MRAFAVILGLLFSASASVQATPDTPESATEFRVLFIGNSLTYANNLPALFRAVGAGEGSLIHTETFASPGGSLTERLGDGAAMRALQAGHFDAVIIQERGGHLAACMSSASEQRKAPCAASRKAYDAFADAARESGARPILVATWGPDDRWDARLDRSVSIHAKRNGSEVFHAGRALQALRASQPGITLIPDGIHPSTQGALMLALALYRDVTGKLPSARALRITAPLLPVNAAVSPDRPMESQPTLAGDGTVTVVPAALIAPLVDVLSNMSREVVPPEAAR